MVQKLINLRHKLFTFRVCLNGKNPFNPNKFRRSNLSDPLVKEEYIIEVINYKAFEEARKIAVFSLHGREQAQKRMGDLTSRLTEISNFGKLEKVVN